jgi:hypothetical protein
MTRSEYGPNEYLNQTILLAAVRRSPGLDFQSSADARLAVLDDSEVLAQE